MRTIDEILDEKDKNGYTNLTDEEIDAYVAWQQSVALASDEYEARKSAINEQMDAAIAAQQAIADNAIAAYNNVLAHQFVPVSIKE